MLDDNLDPTPLLKEIRDDKVATIIIDANASVSYLILKKVSSRTRAHASEPPTRARVLQTQEHCGIYTFRFHVPVWEIRIAAMKGTGSLTSVK